jgi:hypothetical protein
VRGERGRGKGGGERGRRKGEEEEEEEEEEERRGVEGEGRVCIKVNREGLIFYK